MFFILKARNKISIDKQFYRLSVRLKQTAKSDNTSFIN